ncbi:ATP synthase mitochondrial F1 complex assembly factor 2 [Marasmius crinis-equi]|uniref:ATP synthase mitochondrial F1 complex assembly factor 2 n=1 Tax=Marasmius crinis-equi TaxID=585013 RepID=A0ABR3FY45_9AGAR
MFSIRNQLAQRSKRQLLCTNLGLGPLSSRLPATIRWLSENAVHEATATGFPSQEEGAPVTETNRAEKTMKRFWKTVDIEKRNDGFVVTLDKRALKTPSGNTLLLPHNKHLVAALVATEWENQETLIKPHALPMTSLVSRAIDNMTDKKSREDVGAALVEYLDTDTICFYQDYPDHLVELQAQHWDPVRSWITKTYGVKVEKSNSILFAGQSPETRQKLLEALTSFNHWEMAAMERATYASKSFMIALALVKQRLNIEEASKAARVEVESQIQRWGEVEDTHDVDFHDIRRQLGSAACLLART